jgi:hypothetical protein
VESSSKKHSEKPNKRRNQKNELSIRSQLKTENETFQKNNYSVNITNIKSTGYTGINSKWVLLSAEGEMIKNSKFEDWKWFPDADGKVSIEVE